jgi:hypothetical protein
MTSVEVPNYIKETAQTALQANKDHQYAMKVYTERLETELSAIEKLLVRFMLIFGQLLE